MSSMTLSREGTARGRQRGLLAAIDRDELVALLYGPVTEADEWVALEMVAEEAGVDVALLTPVTGEAVSPTRDGQAGSARAAAEDAEWGEPTETELDAIEAEEAESDDDQEGQDGEAEGWLRYWADVAEVLDLDATEVDALLAAPDPGEAVWAAWVERRLGVCRTVVAGVAA